MTTRSLFLFLALLLPLTPTGKAQAASADEGGVTARTPKKGVGFADDGISGWMAPFIDRLGCSWYYDWELDPDVDGRKVRAEFVPMVWDASDCTDENMLRVKNSGSTTLLGFNEPNIRDQSNMTVDQAIDLWPKLMKTGLRLGSPAPSTPDLWLPRFMRLAADRGYRVDFICLHWYGDITDPGAVDTLRQVLTKTWERYHKPIWLTEFSGSTGEWIKLRHPPVTPALNAAFVRKAIPMLESLPFVERYAWFELKWTKEPWATVALVDRRTGHETPTGQAYRTTK